MRVRDVSELQIDQHRRHVANGYCRLRILTLRVSPEDFRSLQQLIDKSGLSGMLNVEMCQECGYVVRANCEHTLDGDQSAMRWSGDGTQLTCAVCGCDGT